MEMTVTILPYTFSMNHKKVSTDYIFFKNSSPEWIKGIDTDGYDMEYKIDEFYTFQEDILLDLVDKKYAYDITIVRKDLVREYHFKMIRKY